MNYFKNCVTKIKNNAKEKPINFGFRIAAAIYAGVLFYLNFIRIFDNYLWLDEAFTGNLTRMSVGDMLQTTASDVHPPFYYLMTKAFCGLFGVRGACLHFVSIIPLGIILIFAVLVIWDEFGAEAALVLITFVGLSDLAVRYNVEIRMYSWASLFVFFALYVLTRKEII